MNEILSNGWKHLKLGDVVEWFQQDIPDPESAGIEFYVHAEHIESDRVTLRHWGNMEDGMRGPTITKRFSKGDLLLGTRSAHLRKASQAPISGVTGEKTLVLRVKGNDLLPELFPFIIHTNSFWDYANLNSSGSVNRFCRWSTLKDYDFLLPPKDEQRRLADILWAAEDYIVKNEILIDETGSYKKVLMSELFTKGIKHKEFKDTEIGKIPEEWEIMRLEDVSIKLTDGSHFSPRESQNGNYRIATVANIIKGNQIDIDSCKRISIQDYEMLVKNGCKAKKGDVLFSKDGTIGLSFSYKQNEDIVLLSSIAIISPAETLDSNYCSYVLKSPFVFKQITGNMKGTGLKRIILHDLKRIKIPIPSIAEQRIIAGILFKLEDTIQKIQENIDKTKELKKMLLTKFLNGGLESAVSINPQVKQIYETQVSE